MPKKAYVSKIAGAGNINMSYDNESFSKEH